MTTEVITEIALISEYAGLRRQFEIGVRIAPTPAHVAAAARSLAGIIDEFPLVPVRLIDVEREALRVHITVAVCLGTMDAVKTGLSSSRTAVILLQRIVDSLAAFDPAFVQLPVEPAHSSTSHSLAQLLEAVG